MSESEIKAEIREFIKANFMVATEFDGDDSFLQQGIIDSLGVLDLMGFIERTYGFKPETKDIVPENFDTLNQLANFVQRNSGKSHS